MNHKNKRNCGVYLVNLELSVRMRLGITPSTTKTLVPIRDTYVQNNIKEAISNNNSGKLHSYIFLGSERI